MKYPMVTTHKLKHVTLDSLVSAELGNTYGAVLTAAKRGATLTPNGRTINSSPSIDGAVGRPWSRTGQRLWDRVEVEHGEVVVPHRAADTTGVRIGIP